MDIKQLKERKKNLKLTTAKLASLSGLPVGTVSKIMTGETKNPTMATVDKIEKALVHEEMLKRLWEYRNLLEKYMKEHPEETVDQVKFGKEYLGRYISADGRDGRFTTDFLKEIGEDKRTELLNGHLILNQSPSILHQRLVQSIGKQTECFIEKRGGACQMFNTGVDVHVDEDEYTVLIPDLFVICNPEMVLEDCIWGAPDWVVEVVSSSTKKRDYGEKMHKYMSAGVREYWIVDPEKKKVITYIEGEPMMVYLYDFSEEVPVYMYENNLKIRIDAE